MNIVPFVDAAQQYLSSHPMADSSAAFLAGAIVSHPGECADILFTVAMKTPFKHAILAYWPQVKAWMDAVEDRFTKDVETEKQGAAVEAPKA